VDQIEEDDVTEQNQSDKSGSGGPSSGQEAMFVAGLLIAGGALSALVLAQTKVRDVAWWALPVGLFGAGIALAVKPVQERRAKIEMTQQEIVALLDQLDPVAKAQVAEYVVQAELAKSLPS
jgi:uncharacterized membrane protein YebE (DUF533 family)